MKSSLTVLFLLAALPLAAESDYEQFLLPLILFDELPGGYASVWTTDLVLRNVSSESASFRPYSCGELSGGCPPSGELRPGETLLNPPIWYDSRGSWAPHGLFLYLEKPASRVARSLHLREVGRSAGWGTRLPIVSADEAVTSAVDILNVPTDSRYRHTLRIYTFDNQVPAPVRVSLFDLDANQPPGSSSSLAELTVNLTPVTNHHESGYPLFPGYAQLDLTLQDTAAVAAVRRLRVRVEPLVATRYWTSLSMTDNATQQVTLFGPEN